MSRVRRDIYRRKLDELLALADDEAFLIMCWAAHAIQDGRAEHARDLFRFPQEAETDDITSRFAIHPWRLETLVNEVLARPKRKPAPNGRLNRTLDCSHFGTISAVMNALSDLENAEDGIVLQRVSALADMHRLTQRQFEWQRGFVSRAQLYRAGFLYGGDATTKFFETANGFSIDDFSLSCFALRALCQERPAVRNISGVDNVGLTKEVLTAALHQISMSHSDARGKIATLRGAEAHTGYKPSLLREYPFVRFADGRTHAPIPDLIILRCTSGLFYDLVRGPDDVKNEIAGRFEQYCYNLLQVTLPELDIAKSFNYRARRGNDFASPDIVLYREGRLSIAFECKATRMSHRARFAEDPAAEDNRGYAEIAKGVFQLWRFASHIRRGIVENLQLDSSAIGVVLTLDTWLTMAMPLQEKVLALALEIAAKRDPDIAEQDRIPIVFCPVVDLEQTLERATSASFISAVRAAAVEPHKGWMLQNVHRDLEPDARRQRDYPFADQLGSVLPWWGRLSALIEGRDANQRDDHKPEVRDATLKDKIRAHRAMVPGGGDEE